jgi:hypothetical protein
MICSVFRIFNILYINTNKSNNEMNRLSNMKDETEFYKTKKSSTIFHKFKSYSRISFLNIFYRQ